MTNRDDFIRKALPVAQAIRLYHRHTVVGIDHIPATGPAVIAVNHSLATYDIGLLMAAIFTDRNRLPRPLIDRLFFKVPYLGEFATLYGAVQGSQEGAKQLLEAGEIITVAPGGMREALRPSSERYQIRWDKRLGFVRLAMKMRAPILLSACPKADDLYDVYPNGVTAWMYKNFKVPVFLARGLGPTPLPRPVRLVHFVSEPVMPPEVTGDDEADEAAAKKMHAMLVQNMRALISDAIHYRG